MSYGEQDWNGKDRRKHVRQASLGEAVDLLGKLFYIMGCNPNDNQSLARCRDNFQFLETIRIQYSNRKIWIERTLVVLAVGAIIGAIVRGMGFNPPT